MDARSQGGPHAARGRRAGGRESYGDQADRSRVGGYRLRPSWPDQAADGFRLGLLLTRQRPAAARRAAPAGGLQSPARRSRPAQLDPSAAPLPVTNQPLDAMKERASAPVLRA